MPLDPALVGHETPPQTRAITAEAVAQFADAVGDPNPLFRDAAAAQRAGYRAIPAMPTFVTRFRVPFAEAGLDPEHSQVLHGEQEYAYTRPLYVGETLIVRHRVAAIRRSSRGDMALLTMEQLGENAGDRVVTGRAVVMVRDAAPDAAAVAGSPQGGTPASAAGSPKSRPKELQGEPIPTLTKRVTQPQIDAYAEVSGDHNPIHVNPAAARAVGLEGTIAHGMLSMAFLGQTLTDWIASSGQHGAWVARLRVRFQAMVRPGDTLTCRGVLGTRENDRQRVELWIDNERGERVISGDADVALSGA
jgi:acyl dehydratase